jgi:hypothetical protein
MYIWICRFLLFSFFVAYKLSLGEISVPPQNMDRIVRDPKREQEKTYREILNRNWLIPLPKEQSEQLEQRFKDTSPYDTSDRTWVVPGVTLMTPTGYVAKWGDLYSSFSVNNRSRGDNKADAYAFVGAGFGDPSRWLGIELTLGFLNVREIFSSGKGLSVKVGHTFPDGSSLSIGKIDFLQWPPNAADTGSSEYITYSKAFTFDRKPTQLFSLLVVNLGIGDGQFKNDEKFINEIPGIGLFTSVGLRVVEPLNLIANWNNNLHVGASLAPFRKIPLIFTFGVLDTLNTQGDGKRYVVGISYFDSVFSNTFPLDWFKGSDL